MADVRKVNKAKLWQMLKHGLVVGIALAAPGLYLAGWIVAVSVFLVAFLIGFFTPPPLKQIGSDRLASLAREEALALRESELDVQRQAHTRYVRKEAAVIVSIIESVKLMNRLTPEERIEVMSHYCSECGRLHPGSGMICCPIEEEPKLGQS